MAKRKRNPTAGQSGKRGTSRSTSASTGRKTKTTSKRTRTGTTNTIPKSKQTAGDNDRPDSKPRPKKQSRPKVTTTRDKPQRLQRLLAAAGYGSRRQCEALIEEGRVEVDGETVVELGTNVDPKQNRVRVDGVELRQQKLVYYAVNKPTGFLSTNADPRGRQRVIDLVPKSERVFPVGRLDQSSQGLMLLTNDGDLAQQLAHPKYGVRKVYRVTVAGKIDPETMKNMRKGIYISDGFVRVEGARILKARGRATELEITLREGKNREIRRILARLGHKVQVLRRIAIGPLRLGDLPVGAYRPLSREEVARLQRAIEHSRQEVDEFEEQRNQRRSAGKASAGSRRKATKKRSTGRKYAESRSDVKARRTGRKQTTTRVSFKPNKPDGGSIIGGD
ncbi:pseudouridine synthase [Roseiconus lacunae]|uniref:Pseudouridine synthase n=1 Tax=Roseiconus lacunae TaxID=2605694 RepID=A0ABT7PHU2_9BACT|nr:pseudouridine synthase [Roseiconus lacunae]MCD0461234.1 rRNA pseudouridine synthase [Roseiconus lacunae]MDM4016060.1 pseudouridine synthase [Roseiconus lacunae]WRQ51606.1 pseudouridine synthase [Stieleria sp. HD01]